MSAESGISLLYAHLNYFTGIRPRPYDLSTHHSCSFAFFCEGRVGNAGGIFAFAVAGAGIVSLAVRTRSGFL